MVPSSSATRSAIVRAATRRGWVWPIRPCTPRPSLEAELRELRALARAGLAGDDHHLVVAEHVEQLVAPGGDRQLGGVAQLHQRCCQPGGRLSAKAAIPSAASGPANSSSDSACARRNRAARSSPDSLPRSSSLVARDRDGRTQAHALAQRGDRGRDVVGDVGDQPDVAGGGGGERSRR